MKDMEIELASFIIPKELLEYFEITEIREHETARKEKRLFIRLTEKNTVPVESAGRRLESKGFYPEIEVQDFPLRGRPVFLLVRRRRWRDQETGEEIMRIWNLIPEGTKYTREFADFLKEVARVRAC
jgi:transposase